MIRIPPLHTETLGMPRAFRRPEARTSSWPASIGWVTIGSGQHARRCGIVIRIGERGLVLWADISSGSRPGGRRPNMTTHRGSDALNPRPALTVREVLAAEMTLRGLPVVHATAHTTIEHGHGGSCCCIMAGCRRLGCTLNAEIIRHLDTATDVDD